MEFVNKFIPRKLDPVVLCCCMVLLLVYIYIFFVLLNYYFSWMQFEVYDIHPWALSNGKGWHWADFGRFLTTEAIEGNANRVSRPVSDFVQIVNAKFRAFCWDYIPPHPTFSCYWPLSFFFLPVFLYKFFRNMGCQAYLSLGGVCLYLTSIGFLNPLVMYMHPAKNLVNFFAVFCLYLASRLYRKSTALKEGSSVEEIPGFWVQYGFFLFTLFFSFFCDETGVFIGAMTLFLLYPFFFRFKEKWLLLGFLFLLPLAYMLMVYCVLPYIHFLVRGKTLVLSRFEDYPKNIWAFLKPSWWIEPVINASYFLNDHPHLELNTANLWPNNKPLYFIQLIYTSLMSLVLFLFVMTVKERYKMSKAGLGNVAMPLRRVMVAAALFFPFVFFHTVMMLRMGLCYYGALYSLIYYIALTYLFQFVSEGSRGSLFKWLFPLILLVSSVHGLLFTTYRVDLKDENKWHRRFVYQDDDIFTGKIGGYFKDFSIIDGMKKNECRYLYVAYQWAIRKGKTPPMLTQEKMNYCNAVLASDTTFPAEVRYLNIEQ